MLRWPPREFWRATVWELIHAFDGYVQSHSGKPDQESSSLTEDEIRELEDWMAEVNGNA